MRRVLLIGCLIVAAGLLIVLNERRPDQVQDGSSEESTALVSVTLPSALSDQAQVGAKIFEAKCAACHGPNAQGQDGVAPPLIHKIYEPSHHGDESFQRAVALGVRQHHWPFGNMPKVEGLTRADVAMVVSYIREVQRENGIN